MNPSETAAAIGKLIGIIETLIPEYSSNKEDSFSEGNVAVCILDGQGNVFGKIWGTDKIKGRQFANLAWKKATQVWITGMKTGEYETRLYAKEFDEGKYGINKPDLIGWEGGQPVMLREGTSLSVGFSGFRGFNDLEIIQRAVALLNK